MDDDQRKTVALHIDNITDELKRDRKKLLLKGVSFVGDLLLYYA